MIIIKPEWVSHAGKTRVVLTLYVSVLKLNHALDRTQDNRNKKPCIYSVHVHPDGKRLATGSLGKQ